MRFYTNAKASLHMVVEALFCDEARKEPSSVTISATARLRKVLGVSMTRSDRSEDTSDKQQGTDSVSNHPSSHMELA